MPSGPLRTNELRKIKIAGSFTLRLAQHSHCRGIETAAAPPLVILHAIKSFHTECVEIVIEPDHSSLRHHYPCTLSQLVHDKLPSSCVMVVTLCRKLANPQGTIGFAKVGFRAGTAQRCPGSHKHCQPSTQRIKVVDTVTAELAKLPTQARAR